jgi:hypothetical protein
VHLSAEGPIDVNVVFSCLNAYYKPKVVCNLYTLLNKFTSGIKTNETEVTATSVQKEGVQNQMNVRLSLAAASLVLLHPDNSTYPIFSITLSKTDFGLLMVADKMKLNLEI